MGAKGKTCCAGGGRGKFCLRRSVHRGHERARSAGARGRTHPEGGEAEKERARRAEPEKAESAAVLSINDEC